VTARLLTLWVPVPLGGHECLSVVSVVTYRSLRRADHLSRVVLPTVVCRVLSRNVMNELALAHWGLLLQKECTEANMEVLMSHSVPKFAWNSNEMIYRISLLIHRPEYLQGGARNVISLIVHITHFYYYKSI